MESANQILNAVAWVAAVGLAGWVVVLLRRGREAQAELAQARRTLTSRNQFLGMMAHEMLTPLQTIISSVELMEISGRLPSDDQTFRRLRRSAQQLEAQMNDTVEFARLSAGRLKVSPMLFQPDLMMQIIVAEYEDTARERGVQLVARYHPQPCPRVITDPARMRQIIANLISNATKYASPGEVVCSVRVDPDPPRLTVTVMDQGPGFDPDAKIWDPFVRDSQLPAGSGLGLAVVRMMAELLQGSAQVVSQPGEGSAFIVQIPVEVEPLAQLAPTAPRQIARRILVVDDNDDVRFSLQAMLIALGAVVDVAESVAQADLMLAAVRYDGVFLDLRLSDGSGYDVARRMRSIDAFNRETPIVALSAYHEPNAAVDAIFVSKFEKPITVARLRSALQAFA
ncbi:MAG: response regulator [Curvibacter lanceolatus]|uniref:hybrid sensor histidine kinase/response regulator n=1 Tax=Curvibacter lanceolatus TaxID=86182 RepID=UPI000380B984|nr:hybrid sensor histidine kinase/response regulator [Curvibacter lanceolatus]MBV5293576.1 response regulator [Curvibacter lanceolatus]